MLFVFIYGQPAFDMLCENSVERVDIVSIGFTIVEIYFFISGKSIARLSNEPKANRNKKESILPRMLLYGLSMAMSHFPSLMGALTPRTRTPFELI